MDQDLLLIGIDGGATKVSGWEVIFEKDKVFNLGALNAQKSYREIPGYLADFEPLPVAQQISLRDLKDLQITKEEEQQEAVYVEACAQVIETLAEQSGKEKILVGLGMPGLKTADQRGISVVANGPRMIHYADLLEKRLALKNIRFAAPVHRIGSDADYCGIGENYSAQGLFKGVNNAYYLGGGTGVADAMKLNGALVPLDQTKEWLAKTWEMKSPDGRSMERFTSVGGMQAVYAEITNQKVSDLNNLGIYPLQIAERAASGEKDAQMMLALAIENLSLLLFERIVSLYAGSQGDFEFVNPKHPRLSGSHPYLQTVFERIIIGQRLGDLFESETGARELRRPILEYMHEWIQQSPVLDKKAKAHYADLNQIIVSSKLREAPALGAGIDAYLSYKG